MPFGVAIAPQTPRTDLPVRLALNAVSTLPLSIVSETKRTEPSSIATFAPPLWELDAETTIGRAQRSPVEEEHRFQLEFVFRDGNQFAGLERCQARSREKLDFALNASLAAINTAKAAIKETGADFSIGEYTALMHSTLLYQRIMCVSGIKPDPAINRKDMNELVMLAKNAA